jgi:hypothetical protein
MSALDAVDGSSTGTEVPWMWVLLRPPRFVGAKYAHSDDNRSRHRQFTELTRYRARISAKFRKFFSSCTRHDLFPHNRRGRAVVDQFGLFITD